MKKLLLPLTITGVLLLGACSNNDAEKQEDSKKSESVEKKNDTTKKSESKKDKSNEQDTAQETKDTQETSTEEPTSQETVEQSTAQEEPASVEQQESNANTAWEEDYENMPNGDAMFDMPGTEELSEEEIAEAEKEALREKYDGGLSSGEIQTKHAIEQGYYDGDNADEVMAEIEKSEQEIANGKYDHYK
ncbi:hypothetical protein [Staphylococcus cohnii]|uniref:hypothetical protein n=1 Tax=Staphylococcus cohnii TaxID=29382 RepID=UPI003D7EA243